MHPVPISRGNQRLQLRRGSLWIKPCGVVLVAQDRRHSMVNGPHEIVGGAGNHRHRAVQPKPRETKQSIIREMNQRRLLVRPLVKPIGGDQDTDDA